ncbi:MAG: hypothetical protein IIC60_11220 [Proteobacteria bacterium]|nr:hypothetical protein [Pseudomonadota bacterium]
MFRRPHRPTPTPALTTERIYRRMSALELGRRSKHGPVLYVLIAVFTIFGSSLRIDYPLVSALVLVSLAILAMVRLWYARSFEDRYRRVGERSVRDFTVLLLIQCSIFSWSAAAIVIHYGESVQSIFALLFGAAAAAAGTSSLAPRVGVHRIFVAAVMIPIVIALIPGFGEAGIVLLLGTLVLGVFYLREGTLASAAYAGLITTQLDLEGAAQQIESLHGIVPICAWCKDVRDDDGFWEDVETYVQSRTQAEFTHSICPQCKAKLFSSDVSLRARKGPED